MNNKILHTPEGVQDIYGNEYAKKLTIERKLHETIQRFGFEDIQTPTFEFFDVYSSKIGTTPSNQLYKFFDKEGNTLVLRPDFTPSIARCAAKYFMDDVMPIRFSYSGNTFTNNSNLQGKLKEVTQMGAELINEPSVKADAEIISLVIEALKNVGLNDFQITIGEVEFFRGLCEEAGLDEDTEIALRECIAGKNYFAAQALLTERKVSEPYQSTLLALADMFAEKESLNEARKMVNNPRSLQAIDRLEELYRMLTLYGVESYVTFDLGMLSNYTYYTGVIFKAYTYGVGDAIVKGGRYDSLLQQFGKDAPAIGFVIVVDDIMTAINHQKLNVNIPPTKQKLFYDPDDNNDFSEKLLLAQKLRNAGNSVELLPLVRE